MMRRLYRVATLAVAAVLGLTANGIGREDNRARIKASLNGYQEVPPVHTQGSGEFRAQLNEAKTGIEFELKYEDLSSAPSSAAIYFGQPGVNGGKLVELCGGSKPPCTTTGPVTGTLVAIDVLAIATQGITAGNFNAALRAIRSGNCYVNVKTASFTEGEIRGQIRGRHFGFLKEDDDD